MENFTNCVARTEDAGLANHLFEVEELEQRLENSWTEYAEGGVDKDGNPKVEVGMSYNF